MLNKTLYGMFTLILVTLATSTCADRPSIKDDTSFLESLVEERWDGSESIQTVSNEISWGPSIQAISNKDGVVAAAEFADAIEVNVRPECRDFLAPVVAAVRHAEDGSRGREYGVLHPRAEVSYRSQAGWCAATVQKNYDRWVEAGKKADFITFLGIRYCPVGAKNDPKGLNKHWITNVNFFYNEFK